MEQRFNMYATATGTKLIKRVNAVGAALAETAMPVSAELVLLRASQINGCGFCTDMHYKDAIAAGEDPVRLNLVAAWREATVFTEPERAALAYTEELTRIADHHRGVSDETWAEVCKYFDEEQVTALTGVVALINVYNRLNVAQRTPAGSYQPGQFH